MRRPIALALFAAMLFAWPAHAQLFPNAPSGGAPPPPANPSAKPGAVVNWLDGPRRDWNVAGAAVPGPGVDIGVEGCEIGLRPPETPEDEAVVAAGWRLGSAYRGAWGVKVIEGIAWLDGMCRPIRYQDLVFVDGAYAGTIAPSLMSSRAGDPGKVEWFNAETVSVEFQRFKPDDSACCPSGQPVLIMFRIERTPNGPVLRLPQR